jgi:hypothetical protein
VVPNISREPSAFTFRVKESKINVLDILELHALKIKAVHPFKFARSHSPIDIASHSGNINPQQHCYKKLQSI